MVVSVPLSASSSAFLLGQQRQQCAWGVSLGAVWMAATSHGGFVSARRAVLSDPAMLSWLPWLCFRCPSGNLLSLNKAHEPMDVWGTALCSQAEQPLSICPCHWQDHGVLGWAELGSARACQHQMWSWQSRETFGFSVSCSLRQSVTLGFCLLNLLLIRK